MPSGAYIELPSGSATPPGFTKVGTNVQLTYDGLPGNVGTHGSRVVVTSVDIFQKN
jgi:hypothetical protein